MLACNNQSEDSLVYCYLREVCAESDARAPGGRRARREAGVRVGEARVRALGHTCVAARSPAPRSSAVMRWHRTCATPGPRRQGRAPQHTPQHTRAVHEGSSAHARAAHQRLLDRRWEVVPSLALAARANCTSVEQVGRVDGPSCARHIKQRLLWVAAGGRRAVSAPLWTRERGAIGKRPSTQVPTLGSLSRN